MNKINNIIEEISKLTIIESLELVKNLEKKWGISANQITSQNNVSKEKDSKKSEKSYNVMLVEIGTKKLSIIKEIKKITCKSLMESKKMIDKLPAIIKGNLNLKESEEIKKKLENLGAKIILK